jgi:hypothetical protein
MFLSSAVGTVITSSAWNIIAAHVQLALRSPLAVRCVTRRLRRHAAGVLIALGLGAIIAAHHSEPAAGDMYHGGIGTVVELCLGVFTAVGVAVAAIAIALGSFGRRIRPRSLLPAGVAIVRRRLALEPRAGPPPQSLLCIWRL